MIAFFLTAWVTLSVPSAVDVEVEGKVELVRLPGKIGVVVRVKDESKPFSLQGELAGDLQKLQSAQVRVRGKRDGRNIQVEGYDLLSVYGKTPIVGQITEISGKIALVDGDGPAILLNLAPRSYKRFLEAQGRRSWVTGKLLLSGEFKVARYGILPSHGNVVTESSATDTNEQK